MVAGLISTLVASAAPTATGWIDAIERALAVALVTAAASRARRWAFVVGSVLVTAAAPWPLLLLGLLCLTATLLQVETRTRNRVVGASIGAVVALVSMGLSVPGPTGTETLVALAATIPILASGYRRSTSDVRQIIRRVVLAIAVLFALSLVLTVIAGSLAAKRVDEAIDLTDRAVAAAEAGTGGESAALFEQANEAFEAANGTIGALWASGPRLIPVVGANLGAIQRSVGAGVDLTEAGASLVSGAEFEAVQLDDGGVDLAALEEFTPRVVQASDVLADAQATLDDAASVWLVGPLADRLAQVDGRLAETAHNADNAAVAVEGLPAMLGADGPRRYLFLFGNPAESRDMGGHIGNWAEILADGGRVDLVDVGSPLDLAVPEAGADLAQDYPASFTTMDPARFPQNLGATPDLNVATGYASELYERRFGRAIDGVVYADVEAFAAMLALMGPVEVPGLPGFELTADNAVQFLTLDQYVAFESDQASSDALESVIRTVFDRLTTTKLAGPDRLGELFAPLVDSGRFQVASVHPSDTPMLEHFGLTGVVPVPDGHDVLGVFNRNAGPSKIDSFLEREVSVDIGWDPDTGATRSEVVVGLTNTAPPGGINETIGGSKAMVPPGTNVTDLVVLSPFMLDTVLVDSIEHAAQPLLKGELWRHTVRVAIPPGGTVTVQYVLEGRVDPGSTYELHYVGQPLVHNGDAELSADPARGVLRRPEVSSANDARASRSRVEIPQSSDAVVRWRVVSR